MPMKDTVAAKAIATRTWAGGTPPAGWGRKGMWSAPWRRGPVRSCGNPPGVCGMWLVRAGRGSAVVGVDHAREDLGGPLEGLEVLGGQRGQQAAAAGGERAPPRPPPPGGAG